MGFVLPAAKNEAWWKAPLFAFSAMMVFDLVTSFGVWSIVTAFTYALVALGARLYLKNKKSSLSTYAKTGTLGILVFDFITGPIMSTLIFGQNFFATLMLQVPFTVMHVFSGIIFIALITPFYDTAVAREVKLFFSNVKNSLAAWRPYI